MSSDDQADVTPDEPTEAAPEAAQDAAPEAVPAADAPAADAPADEATTAEPEATADAAAEPEPEPEPEPTTPAEIADATDDEVRANVVRVFLEELGDAVVGAHITSGDDVWVRVTPEAWRDAATVLKGKLGCTSFTFLSAIDWMASPWGRSEDSPFDPIGLPDPDAPVATGYAGGDTRFQVFMRAQTPGAGFGVTVKADVADPADGVATIIPVFAGANWHEREAHEMYGISFVGHPNLINLYLPGEFEGHPGRKDFPLLARQVKPWPGIVDVEPMPDDGEADAEAESTEEATA